MPTSIKKFSDFQLKMEIITNAFKQSFKDLDLSELNPFVSCNCSPKADDDSVFVIHLQYRIFSATLHHFSDAAFQDILYEPHEFYKINSLELDTNTITESFLINLVESKKDFIFKGEYLEAELQNCMSNKKHMNCSLEEIPGKLKDRQKQREASILKLLATLQKLEPGTIQATYSMNVILAPTVQYIVEY